MISENPVADSPSPVRGSGSAPPPSERECFVHLVLPGRTEFTLAGRFRRRRAEDGTPVGEFVYGRSYLERPDAVEFDPRELPLAAGQRETVRLGGFFGAIRDAMPDAWGRRLLERRLGAPVPDEFDILVEGDRDRAGALGFSVEPAPPTAAERHLSARDLERLAAEAEILGGERGEDAAEGPGAAAAPAVRDLLFPGTSLGGARPKITVTDGGRLWLAKFGLRSDRWDEPRVEHALLRLAAAAGIRAAESRTATVGGRSVLLVRRFDRERNADGFRRRRQISALTLLGADESPFDRKSWSYLALADELRRTSVRAREDLRELFRRLCFHAAVANTDDHPRNHCLTADAAGWRLGPAYDLTPSPGVSREPPQLAMTCGRFGRRGSRENLLSGASRFLLEPAEAEQVLDRIFRVVETGWRDTLTASGVRRRDLETVAPAFSPSVRSAG